MQRLLQNWTRHPYFVMAIMAVAAFVLAVLLGLADAFRVLELKSYDVRFTLRGAEEKPADNIVVVAIDDQSFSSIPYRFPYPRSLFARAIKNLAEAGARLIVVDIEFTEPDHLSPQEDLRLAEAIRQAGNVILAGKIVTELGQNISSNTYLLQPLDRLMQAGADWALVNTVEDMDGFTRRYILFIPLHDRQFYPLAVKAYMQFTGITREIEISNGMARLDMLPIPRIANTMLINYRGPAGTFPTYSFANIVDDAEFDLGPEEDTDIFEMHKEWGTFRDKIVFIGASAEELQDNKFTPFFSTGGVRRKMPGVEVHANALSTLLRGDFIKPMDRRVTLLYMLLFAILVTLLGVRAKPWKASVVLALLVAAYVGVAYLSFVKWHLWLEVVEPLATILLSYVGSVAYRVVLERREKGRVKRVFQQYVAPSVVDNLLAKGEMPKFGWRTPRTYRAVFGYSQLHLVLRAP
ncbi:MAG: CHASE2 domain-containing protein [candidate division KSB1 bacterium]|nr:CHASE2 domain-containing protein [candidate division KSB1 bacterium]